MENKFNSFNEDRDTKELQLKKETIRVPNYIVDEIEKYKNIEEDSYYKEKIKRNIENFLNLAVVNERITKEEAEKIRKEILKE